MTEGIQQIDAIAELTARGVAARESGDRVGALALFQDAIEHDPAKAGAAHREAAATFLWFGLTFRAGETLERALSLGADVPRADLLRGRIAAARGDAELALQYFTKTIADSPTFAWPYVLAAQQLRALARYGEALEMVDQGLERCGGLDAGNLDLLQERALGLVGLGLIEEARALIRHVLTVRKGTDHISQAALILTAHKQFAEAMELFESLEADAWQHVDDIIEYRRWPNAIEKSRRVFEESRLRASHSSTVELLDLSPYVFRRETPLDEIPSLATIGRPTKCYVIDDSRTPPASELTPALNRLLEGDFALLPWKRGRRARQICFQYLLPDCFVYDCAGLDPRHAVVSRAGQFLSELLYDQGSPAAMTRTALWEPAEEQEPIDRVFVTFSVGWNNHAHTIADILSGLAIYERLGLNCPIIVPGEVGALQAELIRASGIPDETPVLTAREVRGRLLRLAVCPEPVSAKLLRGWCSTVARRASGDSAAEVGDEILYISRAKSPKRPLANEEQLEEMLRRGWNCRVAHMEELSFAEQVDLVRRARIIVGPHGAGLANMLLARANTPLIELLPSRFPSSYYAELAAVSNRLYLPIFGPVEHPESVAGPRDLRWRIDLEKVARVLDLALATAPSPAC